MIPQLTFHLTYIPTFYLTYIYIYSIIFRHSIWYSGILPNILSRIYSESFWHAFGSVPPPRASGRLLQLAIPRIVPAPWHKEEDGGTREDRKEWRSCTGKSRDPHLAGGGLKYVKIQVLMLGFPWFPNEICPNFKGPIGWIGPLGASAGQVLHPLSAQPWVKNLRRCNVVRFQENDYRLYVYVRIYNIII